MTALSTVTRTTWRGPVFDARTAHFLAALAPRVDVWVQPTQGSFRPTTRYSADTHAGAGAFDLSVTGYSRAQEARVVAVAREMGAATWVRPMIVGLWPRHIHGIMIPPSGSRTNDGNLSPGAWNQVRAYYAGRDGLASNGPDPHPRPSIIRTYEQWLATEGAAAARREANMDEARVARAAGIGVHGQQIGRTGVTIGQALDGIRKLTLPGIAGAVWRTTIVRGGRHVTALQELADILTEVRALRGDVAALNDRLSRLES